MTTFAPAAVKGSLPRMLADSFMWAGTCMPVAYAGREVHSHFGVYLVRTPVGVYMIDTGHPATADTVEEQLDRFLEEGEQVRFIVPTHAEIPHAGLLARWLAKFPDAIVLGDTRDYQLHYPRDWARGRFVRIRPGEALSLGGDRKLMFVPAVWHDLPNSVWMFDTELSALFVADGFAFLHPHDAGDCDVLASEQPRPEIAMVRWFNSAALFWTRFGNVEATFPDINDLVSTLQPALIAPAHGAVMDVPDLVGFFKESMQVTQQ